MKFIYDTSVWLESLDPGMGRLPGPCNFMGFGAVLDLLFKGLGRVFDAGIRGAGFHEGFGEFRIQGFRVGLRVSRSGSGLGSRL